MAFLFGLACALVGYGSLVSSIVAPHHVGPADWDLAAGMLECFRKIVLEYRQFPWWNPYSAGGYPYFGSALSSGAFSIPAVLSLVFDAVTALKISVVASVIVGYVGMYRLSGRATDDPLVRATAGVLLVCNGGIVLHLSVGHLFLDYFFYPWLIYFLLQINDADDAPGAVRSGTWAGLMLALASHHVIHYGFVYMLLTIVSAFLVGLILRSRRDGSERLRRWLSLCLAYGQCALVFVALAGVRFYLAYVIMHDFPRRDRLEVTFEAWRLLRVFVEPGQTSLHPHADGLGWWEWGCYLGLPAVAFFVLSLFRRPRYEHGIFILGIVMFASSTHGTPYWWINEYVPVFQSMRVASRIRIWLVPFFAIAMIRGLASFRKYCDEWSWLVPALSMLIIVDVSGNAFYSFRASFRDDGHPRVAETLPPNDKIYPIIYRDHGYGFSLHQAVRNGYSHVPGYEPAISDTLYRIERSKQPLAGANESEYIAAFYTDHGPIEPTSWSPNRIVLDGVRSALHVNINPGSYWTVNGEHVFSKFRVSEIEKPFVVLPDPQGRVVLEIAPKGLATGIVLSAVAAVLALALFFVVDRRVTAVP